jgi:hypothetical protein
MLRSTKIYSVILFVLFLPLTSMAMGPPSHAGPPTATVPVDCDAGDSITDALAHPAIDLTIEISGFCYEDVIIERSKVTLRGSNPLQDGIRTSPDDVLDQALNIFNTHEVFLENLSFSDSRFGLAINNSAFVTLTNCRIENNLIVGLIVGGSGVISLNDSLVADNAGTGVLISNGGSLTSSNSDLLNNRDGIHIRIGSELTVLNSSVQANRRAIDMRTGSRIFSFGGNTFDGPTAAVRMTGNNSGDFFNDALIGILDLAQSSVVKLRNTTQTVSSGSNRLHSDSTVTASGSTSLQGDYNIREFSKVVLPGGISSLGSLNCSSGGDAHCDADPFGGGGGSSDCGQCPF